jgi:hypothetical protein
MRAQSRASEVFRVPRGLVIEVETFNVHAGRKIPATESIIAVREDGAKAEWTKYAKVANSGYVQRILDVPTAGERIVVDLLGKHMTTTREAAARVNARADYVAEGKNGKCMGDLPPGFPITRTFDGTEYIHGIRTVQIKQVFSYSEEVEVSWMAPDYNCLVIQRVVTEGKSQYHRRVKSVKFGEPDTSLFEVPSGLVETSPSGTEGRAPEKV